VKAEQKAQQVFGERAAFYTTSAAHTDPQILARVVALAAPAPDHAALDLGTGTGHTAFAIAARAGHVVGTDLTPPMLAEAAKLRDAHGADNVTFVLADAHHLPFAAGSFPVVTCRRAAHHFSDIDRAIDEMRRVLTPDGRLVIDDRSGPEDDEADDIMSRLDYYHDESHVRQYRPSRWRAMLEARGFAVDAVEPYTRHRPLRALTRDVSRANVTAINDILEALTPAQRALFDLCEVEGELYLNHWYVMVSARKIAV
jgi:ubiquinone/menaquinone biosynthesis C-methylase UbiE